MFCGYIIKIQFIINNISACVSAFLVRDCVKDKTRQAKEWYIRNNANVGRGAIAKQISGRGC